MRNGSPESGGTAGDGGAVSESVGTIATLSAMRPITIWRSRTADRYVSESAAAAFAACPAVTVASSTSRSLASPASRRVTTMRRRLSESCALRFDSWALSRAATARVYVVSASSAAPARSKAKRYWAASRPACADPMRALRCMGKSSGRSIVTWYLGTDLLYAADSAGFCRARAVSSAAKATAVSARAIPSRAPCVMAVATASSRLTGVCERATAASPITRRAATRLTIRSARRVRDCGHRRRDESSIHFLCRREETDRCDSPRGCG